MNVPYKLVSMIKQSLCKESTNFEIGTYNKSIVITVSATGLEPTNHLAQASLAKWLIVRL